MPSTIYWTGNGTATAQVQTYTFTVTWIVGETITITIGQRVYVYTITSTVIATFLPLLAAALNALSSTVYPEIGEITWSSTATTLVGTMDTAGVPFTCTVSTNSAAGLVNGGASSTGTATILSAGPYDISTLANYSGGVLPVNGDTLYIDLEGAKLLYGLSSQSAVLLAVRRITAKDCTIGLSVANSNGYTEYRAIFWQQTATSDYVNTGGSRIMLDHGTGQTTYEQDAGSTMLNGTHASNAWTINVGDATFAPYAGNAARVNVGKLAAGCTVVCGIGCVNDTWTNDGGTLVINSAIATALNHPTTAGAKTIIDGVGACALITAEGGTVDYRTTGALAANSIFSGNATLTFDNDLRVKTVSGAIKTYSPNVRIIDTNRVVSGGLTVQYLHFAGRPTLPVNAQSVVTYL